MNQDIEKVWIEEFKQLCREHCVDFDDDGEQLADNIGLEGVYLSACRKRNEEIEIRDKIYLKIMEDAEKEIAQLKEELKRERDLTDFYAKGLTVNQLYDDESFVYGKGEVGGKRAREVQAKRKVL